MSDSSTPPSPPVQIAALYGFNSVSDPQRLRDQLFQLLDGEGMKGLLLVAEEGINGTVAGEAAAIARAIQAFRAIEGFAALDVKYSLAAAMPFTRLNVQVKPEIVTLGVAGLNPAAHAGTYVEPQDWNALISDPDTILIDTRNDYEVDVGTFAGAIDPRTKSFREFPKWFRRERERERLLPEGRQPKVAMFCTGGIRCEKSTAFLKQEGVDQVFHLKGGILKYLEDIPAAESLWQGECFVFDQRVTVGHGLVQGNYTPCFACRRPVSVSDKQSPRYEQGVSCPACYDERSDAQRSAYRERHKQTRLAAAQGQAHVGAKSSKKQSGA